MHAARSALTVATLCACLASCAPWPIAPEAASVRTVPGVATTASECVAALRASPSDVGQGLATPIELLSWNVQKGRQANWRADLRELSDGKAFVALQELVLEAGVAADLPHLAYMAFSQGYTTRTKTTGVATFSAKPPLTECRLSAVEPLLRTPKATSIAEYALQAHAQTLLVVNLHAVNFTLGLKEFATQIEQIREVLEAHNGPAVLGGDFNTWSRRRMRIVDALVDGLGFSDIPLAKDSRKTFNGNPLDHVFTRGFSTVSARSTVVRSSDHNPVAVELTL